MALRRLQIAWSGRLLQQASACCTGSGIPMWENAPGADGHGGSAFLLQRGFRSTASLLDYYSTLGLSRGASESEIKKKYYQLAKKYHPDTNQGDPEAAKKFQEVQRAYDTLRDPQKRQLYDSMGHAQFEHMEATGGAPGGGGGPGGPFPGAGMQVDPEDLFREFFGGGRGGGGFQSTVFEHIFGGGAGGFGGGPRMRARPMFRTAMRVSFEEAVKGTTKLVDLSSLGIPGLPKKTVEINVPAGVDNGFQLRLDGVMPAVQGLPAGDLLVQIAVAPSPTFQREDFDLYVDVPVDFVDACLGASVDVPTIDGTAEVKIKPGTQPNDKLRMRGYGVKMDVIGQRGRRGDQYVRVVVRIPRSLTVEQRRLLDEFRAAGKKGSSTSSGGGSSGGGWGRWGGGSSSGSGDGSSSRGSSGSESRGSSSPSAGSGSRSASAGGGSGSGSAGGSSSGGSGSGSSSSAEQSSAASGGTGSAGEAGEGAGSGMKEEKPTEEKKGKTWKDWFR